MEHLHRSVTNLKLKRSHYSRYWILKKVICFQKIRIPFKIFGIVMKLYVAPALTLVLNMDQKKTFYF
jgi:hypothetical protein